MNTEIDVQTDIAQIAVNKMRQIYTYSNTYLPKMSTITMITAMTISRATALPEAIANKRKKVNVQHKTG